MLFKIQKFYTMVDALTVLTIFFSFLNGEKTICNEHEYEFHMPKNETYFFINGKKIYSEAALCVGLVETNYS